MSHEGLRPCPLTGAFEVLGGKRHLIVLYALARQPRRFNELQRLAPGISHKVLTQTVRHLETNGLVERDVGTTAMPCVRYALTPAGQSVRPVLDAVVTWGEEHAAASRSE